MSFYFLKINSIDWNLILTECRVNCMNNFLDINFVMLGKCNIHWTNCRKSADRNVDRMHCELSAISTNTPLTAHSFDWLHRWLNVHLTECTVYSKHICFFLNLVTEYPDDQIIPLRWGKPNNWSRLCWQWSNLCWNCGNRCPGAHPGHNECGIPAP